MQKSVRFVLSLVGCLLVAILSNIGQAMPYLRSNAAAIVPSYDRVALSLPSRSNQAVSEPILRAEPDTAVAPAALSEITVIFLGMARICGSSIGMFRKVWETHERYLEGFSSIQRIVVLDGFGDARLDERRRGENRTAEEALNSTAYDEFKERLVGTYLADRNQTGNIMVLELREHGGLLGSMKAALAAVSTPIIYVTQDDLGLTHMVPTVGVVKTMLGALDGHNPVRFVLLNKRPNGWATRLDNFYGEWETGNSTITNEEVLSGAPNKAIPLDPATIHVPLMRTKRWSDNNHFAFKDDYLNVYLENIKPGRKWVDSSHQGLLSTNPEKWPQYGAHLLGELHEEAYIYHYNGRDMKWCNESLVDVVA
jgi:hypothetical protein